MWSYMRGCLKRARAHTCRVAPDVDTSSCRRAVIRQEHRHLAVGELASTCSSLRMASSAALADDDGFAVVNSQEGPKDGARVLLNKGGLEPHHRAPTALTDQDMEAGAGAAVTDVPIHLQVPMQ